MSKKQTGAFSISVKTNGKIVGRNGMYDLTAVEAWSGDVDVNINGIGQLGFAIRGGLWISHEAMDELASEWLRKRGKLLVQADVKTIKECAEATRMHSRTINRIRTIQGASKEPGMTLVDVQEGLDITATKLECMLPGKGGKR